MDLGSTGEEEACRFLRKKGYRILRRNFRAGRNEIDIIARSGNTVAFVEVKTRTSVNYAEPWEAVGFKKRKNIKTAAKSYLAEEFCNEYEYRFDVISITMDGSSARIEWMQNAF